MQRTSELQAGLDKYHGQIEAEIAQNNRNNDWMKQSVTDLATIVNATQDKTVTLQNEIQNSNAKLEQERLNFIELRTSQSSLQKDLETENARLENVKMHIENELKRQREYQNELRGEFESIQSLQSIQNPVTILNTIQTVLNANITRGRIPYITEIMGN